MRRLDHAMIFVLIAGTYTPFALLAFDDGIGRALLIAVWTGAAGGVALKLLWIDAPKWLGVVVYVGLGWLAVWTFPALAEALGVVPTVLVGARRRCSTRPAPSSTRRAGRTRCRPSSATTRSSTCSW